MHVGCLTDVIAQPKSTPGKPHGFLLRKQVLILAGGVLLFGESMPWKRLAGITLTMCGIAW